MDEDEIIKKDQWWRDRTSGEIVLIGNSGGGMWLVTDASSETRMLSEDTIRSKYALVTEAELSGASPNSTIVEEHESSTD